MNPRCEKCCVIEAIQFISVHDFPSSFTRLTLSENLLMNTRGEVISSTSSTRDCEKRSVTARRFFLPLLLLRNGCLAVSLTGSDSALHAFQATCATCCDKILSSSFQLIIVRSAAEISALILKKRRVGGSPRRRGKRIFPALSEFVSSEERQQLRPAECGPGD